jgi:hypothetical protein
VTQIGGDLRRVAGPLRHAALSGVASTPPRQGCGRPAPGEAK